MTEDSPYSYSSVHEVNGEYWLFQGDNEEDEIKMWRNIDDLLECERDAVQKMLEDEYDSDYK